MAANLARDGMIVRFLAEGKLDYLSNDVKELVIETVSSLTQGCPIWTAMVIQLIQKDRIRGFGPMRRFLENLPSPKNLLALYSVLLSHYTLNDPENQKLARSALKILAVARRPLSILELAWAVALDSSGREVTSVSALAELVDHQRVISLIRPFIRDLDFSDVKKRQVQLAHYSLEKFVKNDFQPDIQVSGTPAVEDATAPNEDMESLEVDLLNICITYLQLEEIGRVKLFSEEQAAMEQPTEESDQSNDDEEPSNYDPYCDWESREANMIHYDPAERDFGEFFAYAACHRVDHFNAVKVGPLPDLASIETLSQAGSTRLQNWIEQYRRPDCAVKPRFKFDSSLYDPLSITSLYGSKIMLRHMLRNSDFNNGKFLPNTTMRTVDQILQPGDLTRLRILFTADRVKHQLQNLDFFRLVLQRWSITDRRRNEWNAVFDLIDIIADKMVQEKWAKELFCIAACKACTPLMQRLTSKPL